MNVKEMIERLEEIKSTYGETAPVYIEMHRPTASGADEDWLFETGSPIQVHPAQWTPKPGAVVQFSTKHSVEGELKVSIGYKE